MVAVNQLDKASFELLSYHKPVLYYYDFKVPMKM